MLGKTVGEFLHVLGISSEDPRKITGFAVDSRKVEDGFVFFALKGDRVDGHDFIQDAFSKGACIAVVSSSYKTEIALGDNHVVSVSDVLDLMHRLAKEVISSFYKTIVAITGSMGKTTTKEFCAHLLSQKYKVFKTPGNANSQIGLPLCILNQKDWDVDVIVLEMGMTLTGHIEKLTRIAPPDIAVITKIAPAHIEFFSDGLDGIASAKAEILSQKKTSFAVIEAGARLYRAISAALTMPHIGYSSDLSLCSLSKDCVLTSDGSCIYIESPGEESPALCLENIPRHLRENFMAAALIARHLGVSWQQIKDAIVDISSCEKRYQIIERHGVTFINDCYNANPESMKAAFLSMPCPKGIGRKIAALGPMVELGKESASLHAEVGQRAADAVDVLFCIDPRCSIMKDAFEKKGKTAYHFSDMSQMKRDLFSYLQQGDVVLIKASNSIGLWKLLEEDALGAGC